jgi:AraC family transcriptional regulator of adaptative response/methylated-DNA-[protein]-cysteine methyltransferase
LEEIMEMLAVDFEQLSNDYQRIEQALLFLERNYQRQPELKEIAASVSLSEYHFQRLFTRWVGISPKRFLQFLTKEYAKKMLERSVNLLDVAYQTGLSGPGRLHDLFVSTEAVTPGEFKNHGEGLRIIYGFHPTPFGESLLAMTERGICNLTFVQPGYHGAALADVQSRWAKADLVEDPDQTRPLIRKIFVSGWNLQPGQAAAPLNLFLSGTNFQIKVWEALLHVPPGYVVSYEDIARHLGMPGASRAVGNAVARNPVAMLIPCHRVIRKMGEFGTYHWGIARKKAMLGWEMAGRSD